MKGFPCWNAFAGHLHVKGLDLEGLVETDNEEVCQILSELGFNALDRLQASLEIRVRGYWYSLARGCQQRHGTILPNM